MMSRHFRLRSEFSGAIAKRIRNDKISFLRLRVSINSLHYIYYRVVQKTRKFVSLDAHYSNSSICSPNIHYKSFKQFWRLFCGHAMQAPLVQINSFVRVWGLKTYRFGDIDENS